MSGTDQRSGMLVTVDGDICMGHGRCYATAPTVFAPDDEGFSIVVGEVDAAREREVRAAERNCPEGAIFIRSDR